MITAFLLVIWQTLKDFWDILHESAIARYVTFGLAVAILIVGCIWYRGCKSATEKRIEARDPVLVEQEQAANHAVSTAQEANANANAAQVEVNKALENINRVRRDKQTNVSVDAANKNRCAAFPESAECQ